MAETTYEIDLPQFKGPFDLMLFFIQRDELDIYDIPIFKITEDFLQYIYRMQELNMEVASEFILLAATLMKIKAQMMLPRKQLDEEGNEIDPRQELVQKIIEYKRFKELSDYLETLEAEEIQSVKRPQAKQEISEIASLYQTELELEHIDVTKLFQVFNNLLLKKRLRDDATMHRVEAVSYSIETEKIAILNFFQQEPKLDFSELFSDVLYRLHAIYRFLAMLELTQEGKIKLLIGEGINNFWVIKQEEHD